MDDKRTSSREIGMTHKNYFKHKRNGENLNTVGSHSDGLPNLDLGGPDTNLVSKVTRAIMAWSSHTRKSVYACDVPTKSRDTDSVDITQFDQQHKVMKKQLCLVSKIESRICAEIAHTKRTHVGEKCTEDLFRRRIAEANSQKVQA